MGHSFFGVFLAKGKKDFVNESDWFEIQHLN